MKIILIVMDSFPSQGCRFCLSGKRYKSRNALWSAVYQFLMDVPIQDYKWCFQNWVDHLKRCIRAGGEYFEGQRKVK